MREPSPPGPIRPGPPLVVCDVGEIGHPDLGTVEALARLQLGARRCGVRLLLRDASPELRQLLSALGMSTVLPCEPGSGVEVGRQAKGREEAGGVEEEGDPGDSAA
jgi:hypothetical protein